MQAPETKTRRLTGRGANGRTAWSRRGKVLLTPLTAISLTALAGLGQSTAWAQGSLPTSYTVTDLGRLPNTDTSYPNNVDATNTNNVKVAGNTVRSGFKYHGFYWSSANKIMVDIGVLGVGSFSEAFDVNSKGEVVGQSATTSTGGNNHAIYWNPSRGAGNPLDLCPEWPLSRAVNINESGVIVGYVNSPGNNVNWAVCWIPTGPNSGVYGPATILPLPSGALSSGINMGRHLTEGGDIAGSVTDASGVARAAIWKNIGTLASPVYDLPTLMDGPVGSAGSFAGMINSLSQIAGDYNVSGSSSSRAFGWDPANAAGIDLGVLSNNITQAWGLNDLNQVAMNAPITVGTGYQIRAAIWLPQADPTYGLSAGLNLVTTPGGASTLGGTQTRPYGDRFNGRGFTLNNNGQLVGYSTTRNGEAHAIIWDRINKMRDLNSASLTPSKAAFSYLASAAGITDNGFIVGTGITTKGKYVQACLLTPKP